MAIRIGAEDKKKLAMAVVLGCVALALAIYTATNLMSGPPTPPSTPMVMAPVAQHSSRPVSTMNGSEHTAQHLESASELDPSLHPERMRFAETIEYTGNGRNIFSKDSAPSPAAIAAAAARIEKPIAPVRTGPVAPAGPPPPPPIDLKFYGFATVQNGKKMVFLLQGEDVFVAAEGDIVDRRYRVKQIKPSAVVVEDLSYDDDQTLPLQEN